MRSPLKASPLSQAGLPGYQWDAAVHRYRDEHGRFVSRSAVQDLLRGVVAGNEQTMRALGQAVGRGDLTPRQFYEAMRIQMRHGMNAATALAYGGWDRVPKSEWSRNGGLLKRQYQYLAGFTREMAAGGMTDKNMGDRATLYADAIWGRYQQANREVQVSAGMTEEMLVTVGDEHVCGQCAGIEANGWVPIGTGPLPVIGTHLGCRCEEQYRRGNEVVGNSLQESLGISSSSPNTQAEIDASLASLSPSDLRQMMMEEFSRLSTEEQRLQSESDAITDQMYQVDSSDPRWKNLDAQFRLVQNKILANEDAKFELANRYLFVPDSVLTPEQVKERQDIAFQFADWYKTNTAPFGPSMSDDTRKSVSARRAEASDWITKVYVPGVGTEIRFGVTVCPSGTRASYLTDKLTLRMASDSRTKSWIHEFGHALEEQNAWCNKASKWRDKRSAGESKQWLGSGYAVTELGVRDKFLDKYIGKIYAGKRATEVVSVGVAMLFDDPIGMARDDPDFFDFIVGLLRRGR